MFDPAEFNATRRAAFAYVAILLLACSPADRPSGDRWTVPEDTHDWAPAWSPDGSRIAFNAGVDAAGDLHLMDADGSNRMRLDLGPGEHERPRWSPDGRRIVFNSRRSGGSDIHVLDVETGVVVALTSHPADDARADWSPDGRRIVFDSERGGDRDIYVMDADGSNLTRLTADGATTGYPSWSPDGRQIVFNSDRDGDGEIYVMDSDGSNVRQLTHNDGALDQAGRWSPDGSRIVFFSNRDNESPFEVNESEIYVMDADGSRQTRLTTTRGWDFMPSWSPDGRFIVFDSQRDGRRSLYVMTANGFGQRKISNRAVSHFVVLAREVGVRTAIEELEESLLDPDAAPTRPFYLSESLALAGELLDGRQNDEALSLLALNTRLFPASVTALLRLGAAQARTGAKQAALDALAAAARLAPEDSTMSGRASAARVD